MINKDGAFNGKESWRVNIFEGVGGDLKDKDGEGLERR
jgi:hypothetical protein